MTARTTSAKKKSTRKKAGAKKRGSRRSGGALALFDQELPKGFRDFAQQVQRRLEQVEKDVEKTRLDMRREVAKLIHEGGRRLTALERRADPSWRKVTAPYRREVVKLLSRLEKAVDPPRRKKASKKKSKKKSKKAAKKSGAKKKTRKKAAARR